jgi:MFS family permease
MGAIGMTICMGVIGGMGAGSLSFPDNCYSDEFRSENRVACAFTNGLNPFECIPDAEAVGRDEFIDNCPVDTSVIPFIPEYTPEQCACGAEVAVWFQIIMIIMTMVFICFFASGWGPVAWVYTGEIYPNRYRAKIVGMATMANWIGNAGVAFMTPVLLDDIQFNTFLIFAGVNFLLIFYSWWLPETKDMPLEKIVGKFEGKLGVWKNKTTGDVKALEDVESL